MQPENQRRPDLDNGYHIYPLLGGDYPAHWCCASATITTGCTRRKAYEDLVLKA